MARTDPPRAGRRRPAGAPIVRKNTIRVPLDVARHLRAGHPWVYREAIGARPLRDEPGAVVDVVDADGELVGRGLFEGDGAIAVRLWTKDERPLDTGLVGERVRRAIALRRRFCDLDKLGCLRFVN